MSKLEIIKIPDPILREASAPVETVDENVRRLMDDMLETMYDAPGVGLAAIQVGIPKRVIVLDVAGDEDEPQPLFMANPKIVRLGEPMRMHEEGCLSIPGATVTIRRATVALMQAQDVGGKPFEARGEDLLARIWQHEADHLDGRLILDNMSPTDEISNRRTLKQLRGEAKAVRRY